VEKIIGLRIFEDAEGKRMSLSGLGGAVLVVSQFTLYGDVAEASAVFRWRGATEEAKQLYEYFVAKTPGRRLRVRPASFRP